MRTFIQLTTLLLTGTILCQGMAATTSQTVITKYANRQSTFRQTVQTTRTLSFLVHQIHPAKSNERLVKQAQTLANLNPKAHSEDYWTSSVRQSEFLRQNNYMYLEETVSAEAVIWDYGEKVEEIKNANPKLLSSILSGIANDGTFTLDISPGNKVITARSGRFRNTDTFRFGTPSQGTMLLINQLTNHAEAPTSFTVKTHTNKQNVTCTFTIGSSSIALVSSNSLSGDLLSENFTISPGEMVTRSTYSDYKEDPALGGLRFPQATQIANMVNQTSKEWNSKEFYRTDSIIWDTESLGSRVKRVGLENAIKELIAEGYAFELMADAQLPDHLIKYLTSKPRNLEDSGG